MIFAGHLSLRAAPREDGQTKLAQQSFQAPFHISKPYWDGNALIVQVVNPTAGILSGDTLRSEITVEKDAALLLTSPSASRIFHMREGEAQSRQKFRIERGGWFEFWPEPLVPHAKSSFRQTTEIEADSGSEFFCGDFLLPGRVARGEAWAWSRLCLVSEIRLGGELILHERFDQSGTELQRLAHLAGKAENAAFGNIVVASQRLGDGHDWIAAVHAIEGEGRSIGVSRLRGSSPAFNIKCVVPDGDELRRTLRRVREILSVKLPRLACDPRKL